VLPKAYRTRARSVNKQSARCTALELACGEIATIRIESLPQNRHIRALPETLSMLLMSTSAMLAIAAVEGANRLGEIAFCPLRPGSAAGEPGEKLTREVIKREAIRPRTRHGTSVSGEITEARPRPSPPARPSMTAGLPVCPRR